VVAKASIAFDIGLNFYTSLFWITCVYELLE